VQSRRGPGLAARRPEGARGAQLELVRPRITATGIRPSRKECRAQLEPVRVTPLSPDGDETAREGISRAQRELLNGAAADTGGPTTSPRPDRRTARSRAGRWTVAGGVAAVTVPSRSIPPALLRRAEPPGSAVGPRDRSPAPWRRSSPGRSRRPARSNAGPPGSECVRGCPSLPGRAPTGPSRATSGRQNANAACVTCGGEISTAHINATVSVICATSAVTLG
jgi:hypothetical protein